MARAARLSALFGVQFRDLLFESLARACGMMGRKRVKVALKFSDTLFTLVGCEGIVGHARSVTGPLKSVEKRWAYMSILPYGRFVVRSGHI